MLELNRIALQNHYIVCLRLIIENINHQDNNLWISEHSFAIMHSVIRFEHNSTNYNVFIHSKWMSNEQSFNLMFNYYY